MPLKQGILESNQAKLIMPAIRIYLAARPLDEQPV